MYSRPSFIMRAFSWSTLRLVWSLLVHSHPHVDRRTIELSPSYLLKSRKFGLQLIQTFTERLAVYHMKANQLP